MSGPGGRRSGRRPGSADTRGRILAAARASFGERGFDGATIRDVAGRAGVDPALVHHYFGSKHQLFVAAMEFPPEIQEAIPELIAGPRDDLGGRIVRMILGLWDGPSVRPLLTGLLRSATTDPVAAAMLRRLLTEGPLLALATAIDRPDAELRAILVGSQLMGLAMARYVMAVEPIASASPEELARIVGPTIERYLAGEVESAGPAGEVRAARPARRAEVAE
jgi:AcrR family transcriptional regulator